MPRRDGRLELVRARPAQPFRALQDAEALLDRAGVPERAILVGQQDELAVRADPCVAPRILKEQQGEEPERLWLVRHQDAEELGEPDRLRAELATDERLACGRGIPLVEDEVEDA